MKPGFQSERKTKTEGVLRTKSRGVYLGLQDMKLSSPTTMLS